MPTGYKQETIVAAIEGFEVQKRRLDAKIAGLRQMLGTNTQTATGGRRSVETRARMAAAQRRRWAALKASTSSEKPTKKRRLSAEGRKRIIEATKRRWAAFRAAKSA